MRSRFSAVSTKKTATCPHRVLLRFKRTALHICLNRMEQGVQPSVTLTSWLPGGPYSTDECSKKANQWFRSLSGNSLTVEAVHVVFDETCYKTLVVGRNVQSLGHLFSFHPEGFAGEIKLQHDLLYLSYVSTPTINGT